MTETNPSFFRQIQQWILMSIFIFFEFWLLVWFLWFSYRSIFLSNNSIESYLYITTEMTKYNQNKKRAVNAQWTNLFLSNRGIIMKIKTESYFLLHKTISQVTIDSVIELIILNCSEDTLCDIFHPLLILSVLILETLKLSSL